MIGWIRSKLGSSQTSRAPAFSITDRVRELTDLDRLDVSPPIGPTDPEGDLFFEDEVPRIPKYLVDPYVFRDRHLGVAMVAGYPVALGSSIVLGAIAAPRLETWVFRAHRDHWCTVRIATPADLAAISHVAKYCRTLLLERFKSWS